MKIFLFPYEWKDIYNKTNLAEKHIGFVPTMGALHDGHLSLIRKSKEENDVTVVSIFVNFTQFNDKNDFNKYPNTLTEDLTKLRSLNVDYLFNPSFETLYPDKYSFKIVEDNLSNKLCGEHRPGHFNGVLTIVNKLFNIIKPTNAYFGEKDYQQYLLIKNMVEALFLDINVIASATVRENDGLAMSSRNTLLSKEDRILAAEFPQNS